MICERVPGETGQALLGEGPLLSNDKGTLSPSVLAKRKKVIGNEHVKIRIYTGKSRNSTYEQPRRIFLNFSDLCPPCLSAVESI